MTHPRTFVIIGAGLAGAKAAEGLRDSGFDGRILLLGAEPVRPYERPPLSKGYLTGTAAADSIFVHGADFYREHDVELCTSTTVAALDPAARTVTLASGARQRYDKALLATGADPRRLDVPGADLAGVHHLRDLSDADALAAAAARASSAVVVGAGWIGAEVTAALRQRGLPVTLLDPAATPLHRVLGAEVGAVYRDLHARNGVTLRLGEQVAAVHGTNRVAAVSTTAGHRIPADLVVVGIGAAPRTGLAAAARLQVADGIVTDEYLRTSHPDVYAAGDVARAWHPGVGTGLRVEHWSNAREQGVAVAANMLGAGAPYTRLPYFYSDQYDLGMEYTGYCPTWDEVVFRGDPADGAFVAFWLRDGVVRAAMNANVWDVAEDLRRLIGARVDRDRLADPDVALSDLAGRPAPAS